MKAKKLPRKLPKFLKKYFWEAETDKINPSKDASYIVARLLNWGDLQSCKWLLTNFSHEFIKKIVLQSRETARFNKPFWFNYLGIYSKKALCSQKRLLQKPNAAWPY